MKVIVASVISLLFWASASAQDEPTFDFPKLTSANFDAMTDGKTVLLMCYAPWCGHCKSMKPDFEKLAIEWKGHAVGLVAGIDCTEEDELCQKLDVQGFPTLVYGDPSDPEKYEGGRSYEALSEFAKENISKPICSLKNFDICDDAVKKAITDMRAKPTEDLKKEGDAVVDKLNELEKAFFEGVKKLQADYEAMSAKYNADSDALSTESNLKLLQAVLKEKGGSELKKKSNSFSDEL